MVAAAQTNSQAAERLFENPELMLAEDMGRLTRKPYEWVLYSFEWGKGALEGFDGPDEWQRQVLLDIGRNLSPDSPVFLSVVSGHGVGKSGLAAWIILWAMSTCSDTKVVVTANTGTQLRTKTWGELSKWKELCICGHWFELTATALLSRERSHELTWRADAIPWSKQKSEAFAGLHNQGKRIVVIFDEASAIDDVIWEVTEGAMTDKNTEILWLVFGNPTRNTGRFRECFRKFRDRWLRHRVDGRDAKLTNKDQIAKWIDEYGIESDFMKVRVLGEFPDAADCQLIPLSLVRDAFEKVYLPDAFTRAPKILGVDVARFGDDSCSIWLRQGLAARRLFKRNGMDTMSFADIVASFMVQERPDATFVDMGAMGAGVYDRLRQLGHAVTGIQFGSSALKADLYADRRTEMWTAIRDWLREGGSFVRNSPESQDIEDDLTGPEYFYLTNGKMRLESKDDMKSRGLPSPDDGDALALTFAAPVMKRETMSALNMNESGRYDPLARDRYR